MNKYSTSHVGTMTNIAQQISEQLPSLLNIARLAPSVHNTQPWIVSVSGNELVINLNKKYVLEDGDPTGRETFISLGIFTEALCLGACSFGFTIKSVGLGDSFVRISLGIGNQPDVDTVSALKTRCSDRSVYQPAVINELLIQQLNEVSVHPDVSVRVVTNRPAIEKVAELTSKAIRLALSNPSFRKELSSYLVLPWSRKRRGISVKSLYIPWILQILQPILVHRGIGIGKEATLERKRWLSASGLVFITAKGDLANYWFEVGRTYLQVSLLIERAGLSQATSAALVEASNYHEDIEDLLGTNQRILAVLRIGQGSKKRYYSPRVDAEDLITSN